VTERDFFLLRRMFISLNVNINILPRVYLTTVYRQYYEDKSFFISLFIKEKRIVNLSAFNQLNKKKYLFNHDASRSLCGFAIHLAILFEM